MLVILWCLLALTADGHLDEESTISPVLIAAFFVVSGGQDSSGVGLFHLLYQADQDFVVGWARLDWYSGRSR